MKQKGQITIGVGLLWTAIMTTASIVGVYFSNNTTITEKVNAAKTELKEDISQDRQNISSLKADQENSKNDIKEIKADVKELLKLWKGK